MRPFSASLPGWRSRTIRNAIAMSRTEVPLHNFARKKLNWFSLHISIYISCEMTISGLRYIQIDSIRSKLDVVSNLFAIGGGTWIILLLWHKVYWRSTTFFFFVVYFIDHRKLILRYIEPRTRKIILTMLTKQRYGNYAQYTLAMIYIFVCSGDSCCPRTLQFEWNNSWQTTHTHTIAIHIEQLSRR